MRTALPCNALVAALICGCAATPAPTPTPAAADRAAIERQVADTEIAFARTMADRDLAAFGSFLSDEAVFFSGPMPLRGKAAVMQWWNELITLRRA